MSASAAAAAVVVCIACAGNARQSLPKLTGRLIEQTHKFY